MLPFFMRAYMTFVAVVLFVGCANRVRSRSNGDSAGERSDDLRAVCVGACQTRQTAKAEPSELVRAACRRRCEDVLMHPRVNDVPGLAALVDREVLVRGRVFDDGTAVELSDGERLALVLEEAEAADLAGADGRTFEVFGRVVRVDGVQWALHVRYAVRLN